MEIHGINLHGKSRAKRAFAMEEATNVRGLYGELSWRSLVLVHDATG
jgi:hypothetical protein